MDDQLLSLFPQPSPISRRSFLGGMLSTGFAMAVLPVSAETITTDTQGLIVGEVLVPTQDIQMPAYRAMPNKGKNFPVVLVVQEIFGVHEHIKDVCRRLAKLGFMAIAPELYKRQGDVTKLSDIKEIFSQVVSKVPDKQVMADLDATWSFAKTSAQADRNKLGVTGFCWGGRITWLYAAHNPNVTAAVAWYGRLVGEASEMTPKHPVDIAPSLVVPVLGLYGGADEGIPQDSVEKMRAALKKGTSGSDIIVYPDTPHAFHADYRPSYRKEPAQDGWRRMQDWFKKHRLL